MTYEEAIERLKKRICQEGAHREDKTYHFCTDGCMYAEDECEVAIAIKAIEKQIPKKRSVKVERYTYKYICPQCGCPLEEAYPVLHCPDCGQAIDWSDEKWQNLNC